MGLLGAIGGAAKGLAGMASPLLPAGGAGLLGGAGATGSGGITGPKTMAAPVANPDPAAAGGAAPGMRLSGDPGHPQAPLQDMQFGGGGGDPAAAPADPAAAGG